MLFRQLFDPESSTYTYLLADEASKDAVLIDPVLSQVERDQRLLAELGLRLRYTLETHVHADHITGGGVLRTRLGSKYVVSKAGATQFADLEVSDGDTIEFGKRSLVVRSTPGHTDGCVTYVTDNGHRAFTGDAVMIRGCGRTDFQQGDPQELFHSVRDRVFSLEDRTFIFPGHDYKGRTVTTVAEEKAHNPRLGLAKSEEEFVDIMNNLNLQRPKMIALAVPRNLRCGMSEADWAIVSRTSDGIPEVSIDAVNDGIRLIDVRSSEEFEGELGHIPHAELVPLNTVELALKDWDQQAPMFVICRSGGRSGKAAKLLEEAGFDKVASVAGGMLRWRAER